jgi:uncharacterized protein
LQAAAPPPNETVVNVTSAMPGNVQGVVELETDSAAGTSVRMAEDMAAVVGDGATRRVLPIIGSNALQSITDLMRLRGIDAAILPTDAVAYARQQRLYPNLDGLTYVAKLYAEEFHVLARKDIATIADLANQKVNVDPAHGDTAITASRVFAGLGIPIVPATDDSDTAIRKLRSGEIAAVAYVSAKPAPLFVLNGLSGQEGLHFLSVPPRDPLYEKAQLTAED